MKVWSDVSSILKVAFVCVIVGFLLGLCAFGAVRGQAAPGDVAVARAGESAVGRLA